MFLFIVSCLLTYCGIWPYASLIVYELQALQYTHYEDVPGTFDVDKWTFEVASEYK